MGADEKDFYGWAMDQAARDSVVDHLDNDPSLRGQLPDLWAGSWRSGLRGAQSETGVDLDLFPRFNRWMLEQILDGDFYPGSSDAEAGPG